MTVSAVPASGIPTQPDFLRVMHVVLSLAPGGTERLVIEIVRRLQANSVESTICCLDEPGAWADEAAGLGVAVVALRRRPGFRPGLARAIARLAAQHRVDVLHCHHYSSFVYGQLAALLRPSTRVVFTEHGRLSDAPPSRKRRVVNPMLGRLPNAIFAVSHDLRQHMIAEGFPAARVTVLHNGIDLGPPVAENARRASRTALGLPIDSFVVGAVARLDPVKDLVTLVEAFGSVHALVTGARLVIVGDGPEREALRSAVRRFGIPDAVLMTGYREDVRALLPGFDVFVNCSIHEGISLTILEAMAATVPLVATSVGGNSEVVDRSTGLLVPARSPTALASALTALAADVDQRRQMGAAARLRVESHFSLQRMVAGYLATYRGPA